MESCYIDIDIDIDIKNIKNYNTNVKTKVITTILIYHIGYVTIKVSNYIKIYGVNPLYLLFDKVNGYFEENNGNTYLKLVHTNEGERKIQKI